MGAEDFLFGELVDKFAALGVGLFVGEEDAVFFGADGVVGGGFSLLDPLVSFGEDFVDVGFAVAEGDDLLVGVLGLEVAGVEVGFEPAVAAFFFDGEFFALLAQADLGGVAAFEFEVPDAEGGVVLIDEVLGVHEKSGAFAGLVLGDGASSLEGGVGGVVEFGGVLGDKDAALVGDAGEGSLAVGFEEFFEGDGVVVEEAVGGMGVAPAVAVGAEGFVGFAAHLFEEGGGAFVEPKISELDVGELKGDEGRAGFW